MPVLDYMFLCDHVRPEGGLAHVLGAGIEKVGILQVPALVPLGVGARVIFDAEEVTAGAHSADVAFIGPNGEAALEVRGQVMVHQPPNMPEGWPASAGMVLNVLLPVQEYGVYAVNLRVNGDSLKIVRFVVHPAGES